MAIFVIDAGGGGERLLRRMPRRRPGGGSPDWSPDGRTLLFGTYCYFGGCGPATGAQRFTLDVGTRRVRQLTELPGNAYDGHWGPGGRRIVLARNRAVGPERDIFTMKAGGGHVRRVTSQPRLDAHEPDWRTAGG